MDSAARVVAWLAFGPSPELGVILQAMALGGAVGALAASRSFRRTGDADRRWLITTRWATAGLVVAGLWGWNPWLQLLAPLLLMLICTRIFAPVHFGWREPEDYPGRRTRP